MKKFLYSIIFLLICGNVWSATTSTNGHFYLPDVGDSGSAVHAAWVAANEATDAVIESNQTHSTSTGADHTYIDQDVTSGSTPTFTGTNITAVADAAALSANGANCSAGSYPLGVDASGAVETCTDASTETDSIVATHTSDVDAHHVKYLDSEAVSAVATDDGYLVNDADDSTTGSLTVAGSLIITSMAAADECVQVTANGTLQATGSACGGAGGSPGGSDTQMQYNNGGAFGGVANLIWDDTDILVLDDQDFGFGTDGNWKFQYDEAVDNQLLLITTDTAAVTTNDALFTILVPSGIVSNQDVFRIGKGTQSTYTNLLKIDDLGDFEVARSVSITDGVTTHLTCTHSGGCDIDRGIHVNEGNGSAASYDSYFNTSGVGAALLIDASADAVVIDNNATFNLPDSTTVVVDSTGEIAIDTNTDGDLIDTGSIVFYDGTQKQWVVSLDTTVGYTDGQAITYNATADKWAVTTVSGSGDMLKSTYDTNNDGIVELANTASFGDSATAFFTTGEIEDARVVDTLTITNISQVQDITATASEINTPLDGATVQLVEMQQLETIGSTTISAADWTAVAALEGVNTGDVTLAGTPDYITISGQVITRTTIDIGDDTNLAGGTNITLSGDTLNVDDAFLINSGSDVMAGTLTADGLTLGANENITLDAQTLDHNGTDFVFSDSVNITGTLDVSSGELVTTKDTFTFTTGSHIDALSLGCTTADPCGTLPIYAQYMSCGSSGLPCYCDSAGVDKLHSSNGACTY